MSQYWFFCAGLTRGIGLGNFRIPTAAENKNDPLAPWGAFAGFNLGSGKKKYNIIITKKITQF